MQFMEGHRLWRGMFNHDDHFVNDLNNKEGRDSKDFFSSNEVNHKEITLKCSYASYHSYASYRFEIGFKLPTGWD